MTPHIPNRIGSFIIYMDESGRYMGSSSHNLNVPYLWYKIEPLVMYLKELEVAEDRINYQIYLLQLNDVLNHANIPPLTHADSD